MSQAQTRHLGKEEKEEEGIRRLEHARSKARQGPGQEEGSVRNKARLKSELPASETQSSRRHLDHFNRLSEDHQLDYLSFSN